MAGQTGLHGQWVVGKCTVSRLVEMQLNKGNRFILPGASRDVVKSVPWLAPRFATKQGDMIMSIHMLVIDTPGGARIGVDTCVGNNKNRPAIPGWHMRTGPFLQEMEAAGFKRDSFTHIMCTHMHVDHVGFNTTLDGERWMPTFPNAKYIFARTEFEHWVAQAKPQGVGMMTTDSEIMKDSVMPIVNAQLHELVSMDAVIVDEPQCRVALVPTPGHTPGHVSVSIHSADAEALITGDCIHHPVQMARLDISAVNADSDVRAATQTRLQLLGELADSRPHCRVFGTHFAWPSNGFVRRDGAAFRLELDEIAEEKSKL